MKKLIRRSMVFFLVANVAKAGPPNITVCVELRSNARWCVGSFDQLKTRVFTAGVYTPGHSIEVSSDKSYKDVDSQELDTGLEKLNSRGLTAEETEHLMGTILNSINAIDKGKVSEDQVTMDLARWISRGN
jgi:hypothetical protein